MVFQQVNSSDLSGVGYSVDTHILQVQFRSGRIYQYFDVPESLYYDLINASSKGTFFDLYIKKGGYRYSRIA